MNDAVQITIDRDVYQRPQLLMPPRSATRTRSSSPCCSMKGMPARRPSRSMASTWHFSFTQELERAQAGGYECGGAT